MAAIFDAVDEGLVRTTGVIAAATTYYTATWWVYLPSAPAPGVTRTLYMVSNSANRAGQSIVVVQDDTGTIKLVIAGTVRPGAVIAPGWHALMVGRRAALTFCEVQVDGVQISTSSAIAFSGWTFDELYLGLDPRTTGAPQQVAYLREWSDFIDPTTEWTSAVPVHTADLWTDTPLADDLLDTTVLHHDWTAVGSVGFADVPFSRYGALGGWWAYSAAIAPNNAGLGAPLLRARSGGQLIAEARVQQLSMTAVDQGDGTVILTALSWQVELRYGVGPVSLTAVNPVPDGALGAHYTPPFDIGGRDGITQPFRFALTFRCSTYDPGTATYAADGAVALAMNDIVLLSATGLTLARRPDVDGIEYTVGVCEDCDRIWARTADTVPPTTTEGAWVGTAPTALVYAEEFEAASAAGWTPVNLFHGGGGASYVVAGFANVGGSNGWGLSVFSEDTAGAGANPYQPFLGLQRTLRFPPMPLDLDPPPPDPPPDGGGEEVPVPSYHLVEHPIRRLRRAPHVATEHTRVFYRRFELDLERGQARASGQGSEPYVLLRISRDGGQTWGEEQRLAVGGLGDYTARIIARRLGHARDTVFEVVVSDPVAWSLVGAWLDVEPGTS